MEERILEGYQGDSLKSQLGSLYGAFKGVSPNENINFNLSNLTWAGPFLILPLSAYIDTTKSKRTVSEFSQVHDYLKDINFPAGVDSVAALKQQKSKSGNCIPISVLHRNDVIARDNLGNALGEFAFKTIRGVKGSENAFQYPFSELVTNIFDHSKHKKGYLFAQYYPKGEYLDMCIVDRGRGLTKAYLQETQQSFSDDVAIRMAMMGLSTKADRERGYGLSTSKKIVCEGLGGEFLLISGSFALYSNKMERDLLIHLRGFNWRGVIVGYRIPRPAVSIDYTKYVE